MACFRFQESALYWRSVVCCGGFFVVLSIVGCPEKYCRRNVEVHGFSPSLPLARKKQLLTLFEMEEGLRRWFHSVTHGNLSRIYLDRYCAPWRDHKSSTLVEQKSLERLLRVLLLGFSTGFFHATRSSMQSSSKTAFFTYLKKFYC